MKHTTTTGMSRRGVLAAATAAAGGLAAARYPGAARAVDYDLPGAVAGAPAAGTPALPYAPWPQAPYYNTGFTRLMGESVVGGADFSEVFFAAQRIGPSPTVESWTREFIALGRGVIADAHKLHKRDPALARATALRGQNYLRAAEFYFTPSGDSLTAKIKLYREMRAGFAFAALGEDATPRVHAVRVPYGKKRLYGYFVEPVTRPRGKKVPAILYFGGIDTIGEELLLKAALQFAEQGLATLILDGPGMGATLRLLGLPSRYDFESVATAGFNWLAKVAWVNPKRIGIVGQSQGGYYATRSAAFERRFRALVNWGGPYSLLSSKDNSGALKDPETSAATIAQVTWVIGGNSLDKALAVLPKFTMDGILNRIKCPTLLLYGAQDNVIPTADMTRTRDEMTAAKTTFVVVPANTPGATHCQADSLPAAWRQMLPWLSEHLS